MSSDFGEINELVVLQVDIALNRNYILTSVEVEHDGQKHHFRMAWLGCKGDWVWLRKAFNLVTGFSSTRICHMCEQEVGRQRTCQIPVR